MEITSALNVTFKWWWLRHVIPVTSLETLKTGHRKKCSVEQGEKHIKGLYLDGHLVSVFKPLNLFSLFFVTFLFKFKSTLKFPGGETDWAQKNSCDVKIWELKPVLAHSLWQHLGLRRCTEVLLYFALWASAAQEAETLNPPSASSLYAKLR